MPNYCYNEIIIMKNDVLNEKFKTIITKNSEKIFEDLIGYDGINYTKDDWYKHNEERFGTKWDISVEDVTINITNECIAIYTHTAWAPPTKFIIELCKKYKTTANNYYSEPNNDFGGFSEFFEDGEYTDDEYGSCLEAEYFYKTSTFWEDIECIIDENNYEELDDLLKNMIYLNEQEIKRITMMWDMNKYNL